MKQLFDECVEIASEIFSKKGYSLDATIQIQNIFNYASTDDKFNQVINSSDGRVKAELRSQIKFICELGLDTAKGRKLVYVKTRSLNVGTKDHKQWLTLPDITTSYHALIHVLVRSKALNHVRVIHTYQNYEIEYSGNINDVPVVKSWLTSPSERGSYTGVFVVLTMANGETETSYYHLADILKTHKSFSKSSTTWANHEQSMVAKSAIIEAIRYIPIFDEMLASVVADYDEHQDGEKETEGEKKELTPESKNWDKAIVAYKRDGNFNAILDFCTISDENKAIIEDYCEGKKCGMT